MHLCCLITYQPCFHQVLKHLFTMLFSSPLCNQAANAFLSTFAEKGKETGVTVSYVTGFGTLAENAAAQPPAQSEAVAVAPKA